MILKDRLCLSGPLEKCGFVRFRLKTAKIDAKTTGSGSGAGILCFLDRYFYFLFFRDILGVKEVVSKSKFWTGFSFIFVVF
jgi:hypothetical protein